MRKRFLALPPGKATTERRKNSENLINEEVHHLNN